MRLLKAILMITAGGALLLGGGVSTQASQAPPAKKSEPKKAPAQAPAKKAAAPAKTTQPAQSDAGEKASSASQASDSPLMSPGNRRDPFAALVSNKATGKQAPEVTCRAPGKGSVVIDTMRLDGLVRSGDRMIAAVRTPQGRVYFLYEGDRLCDGRVERITMEGMTLRQSSRDAFGRGVDRPVTKRLFPSAGE